MSNADRIPVTVLTGFLGAGKTTLLNRLIHDPSSARTLVVINEFGAIGVDHDLVTHADVEAGVVELFNGCLCCTIRGDLTRTLREAPWRYARGGERWFDQVIIETTGLADPAPIVQTFLAEPAIARQYVLRQIITVVDSVNGLDTLAAQPEAEKQAAVADAIVLSKSDLASEAQVEATAARMSRLNPSATLHRGPTEADLRAIVSGAATFNPELKGEAVQTWLAASAHDDDHDGHDHHRHDTNRHDERIRSVSLALEKPRSTRVLEAWFDYLASMRGSDLLRVKGILNVAELDVPMVIHGVQHVWHPPEILPAWPSEDRRSRIVFIVRDLETSDLLEALAYVTRHVGDAAFSGLTNSERAAVE